MVLILCDSITLPPALAWNVRMATPDGDPEEIFLEPRARPYIASPK